MSKPDPKLICGGGYRRPEAKAFLLAELQATRTEDVVPGLPSVHEMRLHIRPKPMTGLVEWYQRLASTRPID